MLTHLVTAAALVAQCHALGTLFERACNNDVTAFDDMPGGPVLFGSSGLNAFVNFLEEEQEAGLTGSCGCPAVKATDLDSHFRLWSPSFWMNGLGDSHQTIEDESCGLKTSMPEQRIAFPTTCNPTTWNNEGYCHLSVAVGDADASLVLRMEKCDASSLPYVRLACEGAACHSLGAVCDQNADCATGMACAPFTDAKSQCAQETITAEFGFASKQLKMVNIDLCEAPNAGKATPPASGCMLDDGTVVGAGFVYSHAPNAQVPEEPVEPTDPAFLAAAQTLFPCKQRTCQADGTWAEADGSDCVNEYFYQEDGLMHKNSLYPFSRKNAYTTSVRDMGLTKAEALADGLLMYVGASHYVSNSGIASMLLNDAMDHALKPLGCISNTEMAVRMKNMLRGITDRAGGQVEKTLQDNGVLGVCIPGKGYRLDYRNSPGNWEVSSLVADGVDNEVGDVLSKEFELDCKQDCTGEICKFSCADDDVKGDFPTLSKEAKRDGEASRVVTKIDPVTPGARVLMHVACDSTMSFFPNHETMGVALAFTGAMEFSVWIRKQIRESFDCRAELRGGAKLTDEQFNVRTPTVDNIMFAAVAPISETLKELGVAFTDYGIPASDGRMEMPATCSYDHWKETGQCTLSFTGLSDSAVFDEQTNINMYMSVCPGSFIPEFYIECEGTGCAFFDGPTPCSTKSDCAAGLACEDVAQLFPDKKRSADETPAMKFANNIVESLRDFVAPQTASRKRQAVPAEEQSETTTRLNILSPLIGVFNTQCNMNEHATNMISRAMHVLGNKPQTGKTAFCFPDTKAKTLGGQQKTLLEDWAERQVAVTGDRIRMVNLKAWDKPELKPVDGGVSISKATWTLKTGSYSKTNWEDKITPRGDFESGANKSDPDDGSAVTSGIALLVATVAMVAALF